MRLLSVLLLSIVFCGCGARTDAAVTDAPLPAELGPYALVLDLDALDLDCATGRLSLRGSVWGVARASDALDAVRAELVRVSDGAVVAEFAPPPIHLGADARWARLDVDVPLTASGCSLCGTEIVVRLFFESPLGEMLATSLPQTPVCGG